MACEVLHQCWCDPVLADLQTLAKQKIFKLPQNQYHGTNNEWQCHIRLPNQDLQWLASLS